MYAENINIIKFFENSYAQIVVVNQTRNACGTKENVHVPFTRMPRPLLNSNVTPASIVKLAFSL